MSDLEIKLDPKDVERVTRLLSYVPKSVPRIFSRALNDTATTARKESAQQLSKITGIKVNKIRNKIRFIKATTKRWMATLIVSSRKIPAIQFLKVRKRGEKLAYSSPSADVKFTVKGKGEPENPFIQTMPSGYVGLFDRLGTARYPFRQVFGPSLSELFTGSQGVVNKVYQNASVNLARNVESKVRHVLSQGAK